MKMHLKMMHGVWSTVKPFSTDFTFCKEVHDESHADPDWHFVTPHVHLPITLATEASLEDWDFDNS
jgi:hypothetical protein